MDHQHAHHLHLQQQQQQRRGSRQDRAAVPHAREDKLTALPPELLHLIFNYLLVQHHPDKAFFPETLPDWQVGRKYSHSLDAVAATCKRLRAEANDWAIHFLLQYSAITKYKTPKPSTIARKSSAKSGKKTFNALRGQKGLLDWIAKHCIFCGKLTARHAILMNGLKCCKRCDNKEWPDMITKTKARLEYDVCPHHLLPSRNNESGLPRIRYGTYMVMGVATTMFLRKDVERVARLVHPDLEGHLAKRKAATEAAEEQKKQNRLRKREDAVIAIDDE